MASQRVAAFVYGYTVCFAALVLFGYALLTVLPSSGPLAGKLEPVEVSVIDTDTFSSDTSPTISDTNTRDAIATSTSAANDHRTIQDQALEAFDHAKANELNVEFDDLRAARKSFENAKYSFQTAKAQLDAEREKLHSIASGLHFLQRGLLMLFAAAVFLFHWRWLRRFAEAAA